MQFSSQIWENENFLFRFRCQDTFCSSLPPSASRFGGITCMGFVCLCCCMTKIYERKERLWQRIGWITQSNELNESITRKWRKTRRERQLEENSDSFSSSFKQKWFWAYSHEYISSDGAAHRLCRWWTNEIVAHNERKKWTNVKKNEEKKNNNKNIIALILRNIFAHSDKMPPLTLIRQPKTAQTSSMLFSIAVHFSSENAAFLLVCFVLLCHKHCEMKYWGWSKWVRERDRKYSFYFHQQTETLQHN